MKSIEEKAKRYDEAIDVCRKLYNKAKADGYTYDIEDYEQIFPELKESEDEKIRKAIINVFASHKDYEVFFGASVEDILAWLKKQGEQKSIDDLSQQEAMDIAVAKCFEQGEQKPADVRITDYWNVEDIEQKSAWSEEDEQMLAEIVKDLQVCKSRDISRAAKDAYQNEIAWLKSIKDRVQPKQEWKQENTGDLTDFENAMMHIGGSFFGNNAGLDPNDTNAIKEQANLLLELVPKKEWSKEDEKILSDIIKDLVHPWNEYIPDRIEDEIKWLKNRLKSLKSQSHWKPSDEQITVLHDVAAYVDNSLYPNQKHILINLYLQLKKLREE